MTSDDLKFSQFDVCSLEFFIQILNLAKKIKEIAKVATKKGCKIFRKQKFSHMNQDLAT